MHTLQNAHRKLTVDRIYKVVVMLTSKARLSFTASASRFSRSVLVMSLVIYPVLPRRVAAAFCLVEAVSCGKACMTLLSMEAGGKLSCYVK